MRGDPWTRKKTVMILAIADIILAIFLIFYSGYRLLKYDYKDQSLIYMISEQENTLVSVIYWLVLYAFLSLQLVIAFLLLSATNDMTTDPVTMIKKCSWWRYLSLLFFIMLNVDLFIMIYEYCKREDGQLKLFRVIVDVVEIVFRFYGVYFVGVFIRDLHTLFDSPMVQYGCPSSVPPSPIPGLKRTLTPV